VTLNKLMHPTNGLSDYRVTTVGLTQ